VVVLYQGQIVERGAPAQLFQHAQHPYTQSLVAAVPQVQPGRARARRLAAAAARSAAPAPAPAA
jgi:peptide/nickel transport system ATP-binding protein